MIKTPSGHIIVEFSGRANTARVMTRLPRILGEPNELIFHHVIEGEINEDERKAIASWGWQRFMWAGQEYSLLSFREAENKMGGVLMLESIAPLKAEHEIFYGDEFHKVYVEEVKCQIYEKEEKENAELLTVLDNFVADPIMSLEL